MLVLSIVGVALVALGALVLLKFPDRPGGRVAFGKTEVSSKGAGLPLVVVGVVCLVIGVRGGAFITDGPPPTQTPTATPTATSTPTPTPTATPSAPAACGPDPAGENFSAVTAAVRIGERERRTWTGGVVPQRLRLVVSDEEGFLGVVDLAPRPVGERHVQFRVVSARDRECREVAQLSNVSRDGDPRLLENWDTLRFTSGGAAYDMRIGFARATGVEITSSAASGGGERQR